MTALEPFVPAEFLGTATWLWLVFISIVIGLLVFDLGVLHREQREIGVTESLLLSAGPGAKRCDKSVDPRVL